MNEQYDIFISYSQKDIAFVDALEKALLSYSLSSPFSIQKKRLRIYRDKTEARSNSLTKEITNALARSKKLLVVCSPNSFKSQWVAKEISVFLETHPKTDIIPVLLYGEPGESLPAILMENDQDESWAPDFRQSANNNIKKNKQNWHHLLACIYDADRATIEKRQLRKKTQLVTGVFIIMALISIAAFLFYQQRQIARLKEQLALKEELKRKSLELVTLSKNSHDPEKALSLALDAVTISETPEAQVQLKETLNALFRKLDERYNNVGTTESTIIIANPAKTELFIANPLGSSILYDPVSGFSRTFSTEKYNALQCASFSPDGKFLATIDMQDKLVVWDLQNNSFTPVTNTDSLEKSSELIDRYDITFSGDGSTLLIKKDLGNIYIVDSKTGKIIKSIDTGSPFNQLIFDSKRMKFAVEGLSEKNTAVWSFTTGNEIWKAASDSVKYRLVAFDDVANAIIFKKEISDYDFGSYLTSPRKDSVLIVSLNKDNTVSGIYPYNIDEMPRQYVHYYKPNTSADSLKTRLHGLYGNYFDEENTSISAQEETNIIILCRNNNYIYLTTADSLKITDSFAVSDFRVNKFQLFDGNHTMLVLQGYCDEPGCQKIKIWDVTGKKYLGGLISGDAPNFLANNTKFYSRTRDSVFVYNVYMDKISLNKTIALFSKDKTTLDEDEKALNNNATLQAQILMAKRWLGKQEPLNHP